MKIRSLILASLLTLSPVWAYGQTANGKVTTAAPTYTNNQAAPLSLDTSGNLRVTGSFTPPSVQNVQGNVASGSPNAGTNPISIAGEYNATITGATNGQRGALQLGPGNGLRTIPTFYAVGPTDGQSNVAGYGTNQSFQFSGSGLSQSIYNNVFNGTTWDRQRGDVNGSWTQGNIASGVADAGNPVKIGGVYNTSLPTLSNGQRGDAQLSINGQIAAAIGQSVFSPADGLSNSSAAITLPVRTSTSSGVGLIGLGYNFNGTTWDRSRGDANGGAWVQPSSNSGTSNFSAILANSTNSTLVKNAAGIITEISVYNSSATIAWLKLYNASSAPTCGSGTPVGRYMIPGAASGGAGSNVSIDLGKAFSTGIAFCVTTGIADTDTGAVAASTYTVNMTYK